jgi:hypothetical protein
MGAGPGIESKDRIGRYRFPGREERSKEFLSQHDDLAINGCRLISQVPVPVNSYLDLAPDFTHCSIFIGACRCEMGTGWAMRNRIFQS